MPTTTTTQMTLQDVQAQITSMRRYVESVLGFDSIPESVLKIEADGKFTFELVAGDKFQSKRDYHDRIGRLYIWEPGKELGLIFESVWQQLERHMRRDERELRFGLAQLGDTLEGDQFQTAIGRLIYLRMKEVRDEISASYLPRFEGSREAGAVREPPPPEHPGVEDDWIPF